MRDFVIKRFDAADNSSTFDRGRFDTIDLNGTSLGMATYEPGWKWSQHIGAAKGLRWCATDHVGVVLAGSAAVSFPDGSVHEMHQGDAFFITGEHDSWVIGDQPYVSIHIAGARAYIP